MIRFISTLYTIFVFNDGFGEIFCFLFRPFQIKFFFFKKTKTQKIQQQMDMGLSFFQSIQLNDAWFFDFTFDRIL